MRMGAKLMLVGFYTLSYAHSNTGGVSNFVMTLYHIEEDYGRAAFDVRHRVFVGGTWTLPRGFAAIPFIVANSGAPVNITLGQDPYGTGIFNGRPALAAPARSELPGESMGHFQYRAHFRPTHSAKLRTGPGQFATNLRLSKTFGLGKKIERSSSSPGGTGRGGGRGGYGPGLGGRGLSGGGGLGGLFGPTSTNTRYSLTFTASARNIFNNVNLGTPIGVLGSPLFGRSNGLVGGFFSTQAANRRIDLQVMFNF